MSIYFLFKMNKIFRENLFPFICHTRCYFYPKQWPIMLNSSNQTNYHLSLIFVNNCSLSIKIRLIWLIHSSNSLNHLIKQYLMMFFVHHKLEMSTCLLINLQLFIIINLLFFIALLQKFEHHHHLKSINFIYQIAHLHQKSSFTLHIQV